MNLRRLTPAQERQLKHLMDTTPNKRVYRRTLGVLEYGQGESATAVARRLGVHRSHIYEWWHAYSQGRNPAALSEGERSGRPCLWTEACTRWLAQLMGGSPSQWGCLAVDWTVPLLQAQMEQLTGWRFSQGTIRQALHELTYVWIRSRYVLAPDPELEKKSPNSSTNWGFAPAQRALGRG